MRSPVVRWSAWIVLPIALLFSRPASGGPAAGAEDGAEAPSGCWTTTGGCPARTASAATPAVEGPVVVAWEQAVKGEIDSEPLVWGRTVLVASRDNDLRTLTALSLADGHTIGRKSWRGGPS